MTDQAQAEEEVNLWICELSPENLRLELENRGLLATGEVSDMRSRLADAIYIEKGIDETRTAGNASVRPRLEAIPTDARPSDILRINNSISTQDARFAFATNRPVLETQGSGQDALETNVRTTRETARSSQPPLIDFIRPEFSDANNPSSCMGGPTHHNTVKTSTPANLHNVTRRNPDHHFYPETFFEDSHPNRRVNTRRDNKEQGYDNSGRRIVRFSDNTFRNTPSHTEKSHPDPRFGNRGR